MVNAPCYYYYCYHHFVIVNVPYYYCYHHFVIVSVPCYYVHLSGAVPPPGQRTVTESLAVSEKAALVEP